MGEEFYQDKEILDEFLMVIYKLVWIIGICRSLDLELIIFV